MQVLNEGLSQWDAWDYGANTISSQYWRDIAEKDPGFTRVHMVFDLRFAEKRVLAYFGGAPSVVLTATSGIDGTVYRYLPLLDGDEVLEQYTSLGGGSAQARSISVRLPVDLVDMDTLIARGGLLAGVAEVSLMVEGGDYDKRLVLMRGDLSFSNSSFGADAEFLEAQVVDRREAQPQLVPSFTATEQRLTNLLQADRGRRYPFVINGYPEIPAIKSDDRAPSNGPKFIAMGPGFQDLEITSVFINGDSQSTAGPASQYGPYSESRTTDNLGTAILVSSHTGSSGPWEDQDSANITVDVKDGSEPLSVIATLKELLVKNVAGGANSLNDELFGYAATRFPGFSPKVLINASGSETPDVLEYIENTYLDSFPMLSLVYEGHGLGPIVIDRRTGPNRENIEAVLDGGAKDMLIERITPYTQHNDVFTEFELRYNYSPMDRAYKSVLRRDETNSAGCAIARRFLSSPKPMGTIDSTEIFDDELAAYVMSWCTAHKTIPHFTVSWAALPSAVLRLRRGMNVIYTDPDFSSFTAVTATVQGVVYNRGLAEVTLMVWHPYWTQSLDGRV